MATRERSDAALLTVRSRVERVLADEDIDLASETGRQRTKAVISDALDAYAAETLAGHDGGDLADCDRAAIEHELHHELIGLGAIAEQMLGDPDAQEWMINGPRRVFKDTGERIEREPGIVFRDDRHVRAFLDRLLEQTEGKRLDRLTPRVEARLPDGSRLTAAIPPIASQGNAICSIRRFRLVATTLAQLCELEFLSREAADFLAACVRAGRNIVVAGRVSSGKTTLLNALGAAVPGTERVVVCESSAELQLPDTLPNCVGFEARPGSSDGLAAITLEDLVADALRLNPDRILVGECRGPETMAMLWALATGHSGMTSIHGESAAHALSNLVRFAITSGLRVQADDAREWLREIHLVVHCDRPRSFADGERRFLPRRIDEITEVAGIEGNRMTLNPLFDGTGPTLRWLGTAPRFADELAATGYEAPR